MGVDHIAGTTDLMDGSGALQMGGFGGRDLSSPAARHSGDGAGVSSHAHAVPSQPLQEDAEPGRQVAGGVATKFQWVRNGYVPPVSTKAETPSTMAPSRPPSAANGRGVPPNTGPGAAQSSRPPRPRRASLLHKLLEKDIRCV
jgi:hypothetical protein